MTRTDFIILIVVFSGLPFVYKSFWQQTGAAEYANIFVDTTQQHQLRLTEDQVSSIPGVLGVSKLEIKQGQIRFIDSPCKGKVCIKQGWIKSNGDLAACLPNKVAIQLAGQYQLYDSINF
ncbi:MAG: NusG domain II-containing protein [Gammaproteobacteria bacterium]|nr:NusG domain II-containing protein [Gammaproteobacteria bacterium]MDH5776668.1 NusG domain II-containing protein [Gammaproteobacteria bacterium]